MTKRKGRIESCIASLHIQVSIIIQQKNPFVCVCVRVCARVRVCAHVRVCVFYNVTPYNQLRTYFGRIPSKCSHVKMWPRLANSVEIAFRGFPQSN